MHSIGNDIVDLNLARIQSNWRRKGFLEKQFTTEEQKFILNSDHPFLQVWLFWSMKEAAYKCYVQEFKKRFFAPKKFVCKTNSKSNGIVQINDSIYYVNYLISKNYIHSIAFKNNSTKMVSNLFLIDKKSIQTKITNQNLLSNFPKDSTVEKNSFGVPSVYYQQKKLPFSISTAHHGNYGAFAILEN